MASDSDPESHPHDLSDDDRAAAGLEVPQSGLTIMAPHRDRDEGEVVRLAAWRSRLIRTKHGLAKTVTNAKLVLTHATEWQGVLGYDEREEQPVFLAPPPFLDCLDELPEVPRPIRDGDDVRAVQQLEEKHGVAVTPAQMHQTINAVAEDRPFDRLREYLSGLEWDNTARLDTFLSVYFGVRQSTYVAAVGRRFLISAVARTYSPGCKADHVLVLEGPQGIGKSTALQILAGDQYFGDDIPAIGTKDAQQYIGARWIVELAEMDAASKTLASTMKRFLTTREDRYRPPYGRRNISHARRCVFAGTVNLEEYLRDSTGGRRFWPVACTRVDIDKLIEDRDQIWAEAVVAFRNGEHWHLETHELEALAVAEQQKRLESDPWEERIRHYVEAKRPQAESFSITTLLQEAIEMEPYRMGQRDRVRVGAIMRRLGWRYAEHHESGNRSRVWIRPYEEHPDDFAG